MQISRYKNVGCAIFLEIDQMNKNMILTGLYFGLVLALVLMPGCASSGTQRSEKTVDSAEVLHEEYGSLKGQINKTVEALDGVVTAEPAALESAYDIYVEELKTLESQTKTVVKRSKDLRSHTKSYVSAWKKQMKAIENPEIKKHAEQRLAQAEKQLSQTRDELARIGKGLETLLGDLKGVNIVLENDLNPAGVKALADIVKAAKEDAGLVMKDIDPIMEALAKISEALSTGAS